MSIILTCNKCGKDKKESLFVFSNGIRIGLACRECRNIQMVLARKNKSAITANKAKIKLLTDKGAATCSKCHSIKDDDLFPQKSGRRHGSVCSCCTKELKAMWHKLSDRGIGQKIRESARIATRDKKLADKELRKYKYSIATNISERCVCALCGLEKNGSAFPENKDGKRHGKKCLECGVKTSAEYARLQMQLDPVTAKAKGAFRSSNRRAGQDLRTPAWANHEEILNIYINRPEGHHVDHVIPLFGKRVSGLHVETNLQYLTATENFKKNNTYKI